MLIHRIKVLRAMISRAFVRRETDIRPVRLVLRYKLQYHFPVYADIDVDEQNRSRQGRMSF